MSETTDSNRLLSDALRVVASDDDYAASPAVEARLRTEVRALAGTQRANVTQVFSIAASLLLAVASMAWFTRGAPVPTDPRDFIVSTEPVTTEFLPLIH